VTLAELVEAGLSDQQIADRLGLSARTVLRRRIRAGLESRWAPPTPPHGTIARYRSTSRRVGCRCAECRRANCAEQEQVRTTYQTMTRPHATRNRVRWTHDDDAYLIAHTGSATQAARHLGRTYAAVRKRLEHLRRTAVDAPLA
jgi:transposase